MQVPDGKAACTPTHLEFSELDTHHHHLDFEPLHENNEVIIPRTFYLQLLNNKMTILDSYTSKGSPNLNTIEPA